MSKKLYTYVIILGLLLITGYHNLRAPKCELLLHAGQNYYIYSPIELNIQFSFFQESPHLSDYTLIKSISYLPSEVIKHKQFSFVSFSPIEANQVYISVKTNLKI